jgi:hypothetical protein
MSTLGSLELLLIHGEFKGIPKGTSVVVVHVFMSDELLKPSECNDYPVGLIGIEVRESLFEFPFDLIPPDPLEDVVPVPRREFLLGNEELVAFDEVTYVGVREPSVRLKP